MASSTVKARFNRQAIVLLDDDTDDRLIADARKNGLSKSEIMRTYLAAGMEAVDKLTAEIEASQEHDPPVD